MTLGTNDSTRSVVLWGNVTRNVPAARTRGVPRCEMRRAALLKADAAVMVALGTLVQLLAGAQIFCDLVVLVRPVINLT